MSIGLAVCGVYRPGGLCCLEAWLYVVCIRTRVGGAGGALLQTACHHVARVRPTLAVRRPLPAGRRVHVHVLAPDVALAPEAGLGAARQHEVRVIRTLAAVGPRLAAVCELRVLVDTLCKLRKRRFMHSKLTFHSADVVC